MLDHRRAVVLVAAHSGAALRARLSGGARSRASDRDEPLAALLAPAASPVPDDGPRQSMARCARHGSASIWGGRLLEGVQQKWTPALRALGPSPLIPAQAGVQMLACSQDCGFWVPAFATLSRG